MIKIIDTKIFKKIGVIQAFIGLGLIVHALSTMDTYGIIHCSVGVLLIIISFIYYID